MYEKSEQLTGNSISRLIQTQRKQNPFKLQQQNGIRESENRIFRYPYLMERSTEKIKDDKSDKNSEKPLRKTQHRRKIFQARSTMQTQMKQSTLSMDRNRANSANSHDKNPVRQKIKNSCNKSYGRRVSQQGSFTHGSFFRPSVPVVFSYQSPSGTYFQPSMTVNQKPNTLNRVPFGNANYQQFPANRIQQRVTGGLYQPNFVDQRFAPIMTNSKIYRAEEPKPRPSLNSLNNNNPQQLLNPYPPGFPPVYLPNSIKQDYYPQAPSIGGPIQQIITESRNSAPKPQSPVKIKNIKNILNSNPSIIPNIQQILPKPTTATFHPQPPSQPQPHSILTNSRPKASHLTAHNLVNPNHNEKSVVSQSRPESEEQDHKRAAIEPFEQKAATRNMYETYKGGKKFRKKQSHEIQSKRDTSSRKKVQSVSSFVSNKNFRNLDEFQIDLPEEMDNMHHHDHDHARYQDRFFDIEQKHHQQHKTHKALLKLPQTKRHFSQDFKSPQSSPDHSHELHHPHPHPHHQHQHQHHNKNDLKTSVQSQKDLAWTAGVQKRVSQNKNNEIGTEIKIKMEKQNLVSKLGSEGKLVTFFLLLFGIVLVLCQIVK